MPYVCQRDSGKTVRGPRGFSLIELLVSISIIAVLIGILIPTLPRVMDSARRTTCQANMSSIWQGFTMHLNDNNDRFPQAKYMPDPWLSGSEDPSLPEALAEYFEGEESRVWKCPGDSSVFGYEYEVDGHVHTGGCSYVYTTALAGNTVEETFFFRRLSMQPTDIPVINDYDGGEFETQDGETIQVDFFHSKRNFIFADGRIGYVE
jgi:prepilin-type N-terminal cleavage/methylation domain-containing protein